MTALCLGTAQFGLAYGISNAAGQVSIDEAARILDRAQGRGVSVLDTAPAYGAAEDVLGQLGASSRFLLISKTPQLRAAQITGEHADTVRRSIETSLLRLRAHSLGGLLVHWPNDLLAPGGDRLYRALEDVRTEGLTGGIGVSVYEPAEVTSILERYPIDLLQVPLNVLDQRAARSGALAAAKARGVTIYARSAFLQGLLLMDEATIPLARAAARPALAQFRRAAAEAGVSPLVAALGYPTAQTGVDFVVCGVTSEKEFDEIADAFAASERVFESVSYAVLALEDPDVIDPRCW